MIALDSNQSSDFWKSFSLIRLMRMSVLSALFAAAAAVTARGAEETPLLPAPGDTPPVDVTAPVVPTPGPTTAPTNSPTTNPTTSPAGAAPTPPVVAGPVFDPEETPATEAPVMGIVPSYLSRKMRSYMSSGRLARTATGADAMTTPKVDPLPAAKPLPKDFALLKQRSIFSRKSIVTQVIVDTGPTTRRIETPPPAVKPEASLVLTGVGNDDGMYTALVEDTIAAKIMKLHIGDSVASGSVTAMTLGSLDYSVKGAVTIVTVVKIGQNFEGGAGIISTTRPSAAITVNAPGGTSPGGSPGASGPTGAASGSAADIIEKLRRKRAAELGGGK